jgi:hypothetical protein
MTLEHSTARIKSNAKHQRKILRNANKIFLGIDNKKIFGILENQSLNEIIAPPTFGSRYACG